MVKLKRNFLLLEVLAAFALVTAMIFPMARFYTRCRLRNHEKLLEIQSASLVDKAFLQSFLRIRERLKVADNPDALKELAISSPDLFIYTESGVIRFINYDYCVIPKKHLEQDGCRGWLVEVELRLHLLPRLNISSNRDVFIKL